LDSAAADATGSAPIVDPRGNLLNWVAHLANQISTAPQRLASEDIAAFLASPTLAEPKFSVLPIRSGRPRHLHARNCAEKSSWSRKLNLAPADLLCSHSGFAEPSEHIIITDASGAIEYAKTAFESHCGFPVVGLGVQQLIRLRRLDTTADTITFSGGKDCRGRPARTHVVPLLTEAAGARPGPSARHLRTSS
jgi:hypothetical protein